MKPSLLHRPLAQTNLSVSCLGFGTMAVGGQYTDVSAAAAAATIAAARAHGITFFDTAPQYGCGLAEERLGAARLDARASPSQPATVISTKVGKTISPLGSGGQRQQAHHFPGGHDCEMVFDYSFDGTLRQIDASLARLRTDRLDAVLIHDITRFFHGDPGVHAVADQAITGAVRALKRLRDEGVIAAIGTGLKDVDIAARFVEEADIDVVLIPGRITLLDQSADEHGLLDLCLKHDVSVVAAAPFDSGILVTGAVDGARYSYQPASEAILTRVRAIEGICKKYSVPLPAAALQFPLRHPAVASVLAGMRSPDEVLANVTWMTTNVPQALWHDLAMSCGLRLPERA